MVRPAENMPLTKWHGSEGNFCYKMVPFVTKMSPQRGHGSTHSIAEIGTGIFVYETHMYQHMFHICLYIYVV